LLKKPNTINSKGIIFSIDSILAVLIIFLMIFVFVYSIGLKNKKNLENLSEFALFRKAFSLSDLIVKNRNVNFPEKGSACVDFLKKRIIENCVDSALISKSDFLKIKESNVSNVKIVKMNGFEKIFFNTQKKGPCISVERLVLFEKQKAKLIVKVCENE